MNSYFSLSIIVVLFLVAELIAINIPKEKSVSHNYHLPKDMVYVSGGDSTLIGSSQYFQQETPIKAHQVKGFFMDVHPVTVEAFSLFIAATGYRTDAEKFGNAGVFNIQKKEWELVQNANWQNPLGPQYPKAALDHPATQVSWNDAIAYCKWAGKRLPIEVEWEYAARNAGSILHSMYPWGNDKIKENGLYKANIWQGIFPHINKVEDGYQYTSPVGAFGETELGLQDMVGNVWEWCSNWKVLYNEDEQSYIPHEKSEKAMRGGSFLCDPGWCHGYRVSARSGSTPETSLFHIGFRCVKDLPN